MEIKQRMSTRFAWLLGAVVLVLLAIGGLVACGSTYSSSSDGLVIVGSQGSALIQTFSFSLASGHIAGVSNPPPTPGIPTAIVLDPAGAYAYTIVAANAAVTNSSTGIAAFKVNSNGTMTAVGNVVTDPNPVALAMDTSGKFLFVAEGLNSVPTPPGTIPPTVPCPGTTAQYGICVYAISAGTLTPVPGTFNFVNGTGFQTPNFAALAPTPTVLPSNGINGIQNSVCSDTGNNAPTTEYLYAADSVNNVVWEFQVDMSTGALGNPGIQATVPSFPAGSVPSGVAVDPCNRFVYVSNQTSNNVSAYTMCNGSVTQSSTNCPATDGKLVPVTGSPFSLTGGANGPGPMLVDPFGNFVYVVDVKSNMVSPFHISPVSGSLTAGSVAATGLQPTAIAIRGDDNWLFVTNFAGATLSQYSITPATGVLTPLPLVTTDNYPWGVAVK
jgi:6-phosphogluconolactonase (cycloisomerase 2 family)